MNRNTQELIIGLNALLDIELKLTERSKKSSAIKEDIVSLKAYIEYEINKTIKDIIHIERL